MSEIFKNNKYKPKSDTDKACNSAEEKNKS